MAPYPHATSHRRNLEINNYHSNASNKIPSEYTKSLNTLPIKTDHHKLSSQKVENGTKDESNQRTCEDNDVVRHAEIRRSKIDEQGRSVNPTIQQVGVIRTNGCNDSRG